jgi:hypothetical protein
VSSAWANRIEINANNFRISFLPGEPEVISNNAGLETVRCPVTLEGTLHSRTIQKVSGALIGYVTKAFIRGGNGAGECTGGRARFFSETLPWHVDFVGFSGILPNVTSLTFMILGLKLGVEPNGSGVNCTATSSASEPHLYLLHVEAGAVTEATGMGTIRLAGPGPCGLARATAEGTTRMVSLLGTTEGLRIRLI